VGLWDDFTDAVSDAADAVGDAVTQGGVGDALGAVGRAVDTATFGLAGRAMDATDDYVFDTVDYVTAGTIDVDFDGGQFSASTGIDGVAQWGASIGEAGVTANGEALIGGSFDLRMTDEGFLATGSAGVDWGPLPYAAAHIQLDPNGDVKINGEFQGTLPTPYGIFSGEGSAGFTSTDAGWGGYLDSQGQWITPTGVTIGAGEHLAYQQNADGSSELSVGVNGSVGYAGGPTFGGGVDYARAEDDLGNIVQSVGVDGHVSYLGATARGSVDYQRAESADGDVVEGVHLEGEVDALGMKAGAEADYRHADVDGVERSDWSGDASFDGPDAGAVVSAAGRYASSELGGGDEAGMADVSDLSATGFDAVDMGSVDMGSVDVGSMDMAPMTDLGSAVQSADDVEQSLDAMTQDLA
jgi:hypothetical protein